MSTDVFGLAPSPLEWSRSSWYPPSPSPSPSRLPSPAPLIDVKPDNILESAVGSGVYCLGDFGLCTPLNVLHTQLPVQEGDARYLSDELLNENFTALDKVQPPHDSQGVSGTLSVMVMVMVMVYLGHCG